MPSESASWLASSSSIRARRSSTRATIAAAVAGSAVSARAPDLARAIAEFEAFLEPRAVLGRRGAPAAARHRHDARLHLRPRRLRRLRSRGDPLQHGQAAARARARSAGDGIREPAVHVRSSARSAVRAASKAATSSGSIGERSSSDAATGPTTKASASFARCCRMTSRSSSCRCRTGAVRRTSCT